MRPQHEKVIPASELYVELHSQVSKDTPICGDGVCSLVVPSVGECGRSFHILGYPPWKKIQDDPQQIRTQARYDMMLYARLCIECQLSMRPSAGARPYLQQKIPFADCVCRIEPVSEWNTYRLVAGVDKCSCL